MPNTSNKKLQKDVMDRFYSPDRPVHIKEFKETLTAQEKDEFGAAFEHHTPGDTRRPRGYAN